jgi:Lrp/AsnC family leucine-responsive transcriptional regulator
MDSFDIALLSAVQKNNRLTSETLADLVGLSATACQRRLKKLRDDGIIKADVAIISPEAVGRPITMIVGVTLERERADLTDAFKRSMLETPEVMQCYYVTGEADFILIITVKDMQDYELFARRFFQDNPNVTRFYTNVVVDSVKAGMAIPLPT